MVREEVETSASLCERQHETPKRAVAISIFMVTASDGGLLSDRTTWSPKKSHSNFTLSGRQGAVLNVSLLSEDREEDQTTDGGREKNTGRKETFPTYS